MAAVLPLAWGRGACVGLARLALRLRPGDRAVALANLARALPELNPRGRQELMQEAATHLGRNLFQTMAAPRLLARPDTIVEEIGGGADTFTIGEHLADLAADGRGVFVLTGHIGCWELAGGWVARELAARKLGALGVVTGTIHNPAVDRLIQARRRRLGLQVLPREAGAAPLLRFLRQGGVVAILQDQRTQVRNLAVPFFGTPAPTPAGLATMSLKYGIPVLPVVGVWDEARRVQVMHHLPPLRPHEFGPEDALSFLTRCNAALETFIRRNPEQWVWFHRRWNPDP